MSEAPPENSRRRLLWLGAAAAAKLFVTLAWFAAGPGCGEEDQQAAYDAYAEDHAQRECRISMSCGEAYVFGCDPPHYDLDECDYFDAQVAADCLAWLDQTIEELEALPPNSRPELCASAGNDLRTQCPNPVDPGELFDGTCIVSPE